MTAAWNALDHERELSERYGRRLVRIAGLAGRLRARCLLDGEDISPELVAELATEIAAAARGDRDTTTPGGGESS